jgi:ribonucleoside-diphosphate reductase alpha chain
VPQRSRAIDANAANLSLTDNARRVLEARYLRRDADGNVAETPPDLFARVARAVASAERRFTGAGAAARWEQAFFDAMTRLDFLPNSPTLMNAGTPAGQLAACFVLPVADSMEDIFDALKLMALIQQSGGGTGFSFSRLRPQGDLVGPTGGAASGPVSFMRIFDCATENIRQGGRRRGANMGVLRVDHPDVEAFIDAKLDGASFRNFNLSVAVTDAFMAAAAAGEPFALRHPSTGARVRTVPAAQLMDRIVRAAWQTGDPGLIFLDAVAAANPTPALGAFEATNPCGEVPLLAYEACTLGSINLAHMVRPGAGAGRGVDWPKLAETVRLGIRFLDDVIEVCRWPAPRVADMAWANRKVGLGVMGFAELLILLGVPYASERGAATAEEVMRFVAAESRAASQELAEERGVFPNWPRSVHAPRQLRVRNATCTSIAPTGTIGILAATSAGIEPLFALAYRREHVLNDRTLTELNPLVMRHARAHGLDGEAFARELARAGRLADVAGVPAPTRALFATALEIDPDDHLRIQAAFQRHTDNAVSKTINLPESATADDIAAIYTRAWGLGLKGITVYRYGSKGEQVLRLGAGDNLEAREHFARCDPHACA